MRFEDAISTPPRPRPTDRPTTGELQLTTRTVDGRTEISRQFHRGALRILRPHRPDDGSGRAEITVVNPGGGFLGADDYHVSCTAGPGTRTLLTTQSATKIYRTPQGPARQAQHVGIAAGASVELVPEATIAYREAEFVQRSEIDLEDGSAQFFGAEIVTPGWSPEGEPFRYRRVRLSTTVRVSGAPLLVDNLLLAPEAVDLPGLGHLEGRTHVASVIIAGSGADADLLESVRAICAEAGAQSTDPGDGPGRAGDAAVVAGSSLSGAVHEASAVVVRALADSTDPLVELIRELGLAAREARGEAPARRWDLRRW